MFVPIPSQSRLPALALMTAASATAILELPAMTIDMSLDKRKLSLTTQSNVNYLLHLLIHDLNTLYMTLGECDELK